MSVFLHLKHSTDGDYLVEWSTMCDAPLSVTKWDVTLWSVHWSIRERIQRVIDKGHSMMYDDGTPEEYVAFNRAGPDESCIGVDEIIERWRLPTEK